MLHFNMLPWYDVLNQVELGIHDDLWAVYQGDDGNDELNQGY